MPHDAELTDRCRRLLSRRRNLSEKKMFGGVCFFANNNMVGGIESDNLVIRVGPDVWENALDDPLASVMDLTGKPMKGFVYVKKAKSLNDATIIKWFEKGLKYARSLPPK